MSRKKRNPLIIFWILLLVLNILPGSLWQIAGKETDGIVGREETAKPLPYGRLDSNPERETDAAGFFVTVSAQWSLVPDYMTGEIPDIDKSVTFLIYKDEDPEPIREVTIPSDAFDSDLRASIAVAEDKYGNPLPERENGREVLYDIIEKPAYQDSILERKTEWKRNHSVEFHFENRMRNPVDAEVGTVIFVEKKWVGEKSEARFHLYRRQPEQMGEYVSSMTLYGNSISNVWEDGVFFDREDSQGEFEYYVVEEEMDDFAVSTPRVEELLITDIPGLKVLFTNTAKPKQDKPDREPEPKQEEMVVEVEKIWKHPQQGESKSVTFRLYKNDVLVNESVLEDHLFHDEGRDSRAILTFRQDSEGNPLPEMENGEPVNYRVEEVPEGGVNQLLKEELPTEEPRKVKYRFINEHSRLHEIPTVRIMVEKVWEGEPVDTAFVVSGSDGSSQKIAMNKTDYPADAKIWETTITVKMQTATGEAIAYEIEEMVPQEYEVEGGQTKKTVDLSAEKPQVSFKNIRKAPKEPEQPKEPKEPEQPKQPEEPKQPNQPEEPKEPEQPNQPEEPKEPEQPNQPEEPKEPEQPNQSEEPKEPEQPNQPEEPKEPEQPKEPKEPEQPKEPKEPQQPKQPEGPKVPKEPETPYVPYIPAVPVAGVPVGEIPAEDPQIPQNVANIPEGPSAHELPHAPDVSTTIPEDELEPEPIPQGNTELPKTAGLPLGMAVVVGFGTMTAGILLKGRKAE